MQRINIGCGDQPTLGWRNFDNSLSLKVAKVPVLPSILINLGFFKEQASFIKYCKNYSIEYGDAVKGLPMQSGCADVLYSSHMIEHLNQTEMRLFLKEARRVLISGGIIRLVVPDLLQLVQDYLETKDADKFMTRCYVTEPLSRSFLRRIQLLLVGARNHQWMYDGLSLSCLLVSNGFTSPRVLKAGETQIQDPQNLDLFERSSESVYVEAINP